MYIYGSFIIDVAHPSGHRFDAHALNVTICNEPHGKRQQQTKINKQKLWMIQKHPHQQHNGQKKRQENTNTKNGTTEKCTTAKL